jgi:hypothetical protein
MTSSTVADRPAEQAFGGSLPQSYW